ncbi:unnamed protein product [Closterium sp. Yama58-4]|nr:unnamed protein product [Closterium sp. Yama58-4]
MALDLRKSITNARLADATSLEPSDRAFSLSRLLSPRSGIPRSSSFSRGNDKNDVKSNVSALSASVLSANAQSATEPAGLHSEAARTGSGEAAGDGWVAPQATASARVALEVEGSEQPKLLLEARSARIAHVSRGLLRALGYTNSDDFGGKSLYDLADGLYEADWSRAVEAVTKNNRASVQIHFKLLKSDRAGDLVGTRVALSLNVAGDEEGVAGDGPLPAFLFGDLSPAPPQSSAPAAGAASGFRVRRVEVIIKERSQDPLQTMTGKGTAERLAFHDNPGKYRDLGGSDCDSLGDRNGDSSRIDGESCDNSLESSSTSAEPHSTSPQEQITSPGSDWQAGSETNSDWSRESESQQQGLKTGIGGAATRGSHAQRSAMVSAFGAPSGSTTPPRALSRPPRPSRGNSYGGSGSRTGGYHSARKPPVPRVSSTGSMKSVQFHESLNLSLSPLNVDDSDPPSETSPASPATISIPSQPLARPPSRIPSLIARSASSDDARQLRKQRSEPRSDLNSIPAPLCTAPDPCGLTAGSQPGGGEPSTPGRRLLSALSHRGVVGAAKKALEAVSSPRRSHTSLFASASAECAPAREDAADGAGPGGSGRGGGGGVEPLIGSPRFFSYSSRPSALRPSASHDSYTSSPSSRLSSSPSRRIVPRSSSLEVPRSAGVPRSVSEESGFGTNGSSRESCAPSRRRSLLAPSFSKEDGGSYSSFRGGGGGGDMSGCVQGGKQQLSGLQAPGVTGSVGGCAVECRVGMEGRRDDAGSALTPKGRWGAWAEDEKSGDMDWFW